MKTYFMITIFPALALMFVAADFPKGYYEVAIHPPIKAFGSEIDGTLLLHKPLYSRGFIQNSTTRHRLPRESKACKLPTKVTDSLINCKVYPNRAECIQTCVFGSTLSDGVQRKMRCRNDENKWKPVSQFEKCKPFIDCSVTLSPGGSYQCYTNYLDRGPTCDISCARYEDRKAESKKTYKCDIKGKWSPKLPSCAKAGSDMELVPQPKVIPEYAKKPPKNH